MNFKSKTVETKHRYSSRLGKWGYWVEPSIGMWLFEFNEDLWSVEDDNQKNLTFINNL